MSELTEVMRQQGDPLFIDIFNASRIGELSDKDVEVLNSRKNGVESFVTVATAIFAGNIPKDSYNQSKLDILSGVDIEIYTVGEVPQETPAILI